MALDMFFLMDLDMFFNVFFMGLEMVLAKIVKQIVNFSGFWLKKRFYRDLGGIYDVFNLFLRFWYGSPPKS